MSYFRNSYPKPDVQYSTLSNVDITKEQLVEQDISQIGDYYNLSKNERIFFAQYPFYKVVEFHQGSLIVRCNLISCYREHNGVEYASWFNLNYLMAKDADGIPIFPHFYVSNNIQERVNFLLDWYKRNGSFSICSGYLIFQRYEEEILGGFNGSSYRDIKGYSYSKNIQTIKKFTLSPQSPSIEMIRCLHRGFELYRVVLMIEENLSLFQSNFKLRFKSGFFDSKTTYGLDYEEDSWTYILITSFTSIYDVKNGLQKHLLSLVKEIRSVVPSNVWHSLVYDLIKKYFR